MEERGSFDGHQNRDPSRHPKCGENVRCRRQLATCCMHSKKSQNARILRGCVISCGAGLVVLLGVLARSASPHLQHINGLGPSRRQGSRGGLVRCLVSLKAVGGLEPSAELGAVLIRSIASALAADEADVRILTAQSRSAFIVDVSLEIQAPANSRPASLARTVRQKLGGSELTGALSAEGLALTAAFRADPQPFSAAGLPQLFAASDQAEPGLVAGILVPLLVLLPALVFCILHYQLIERFVSRPALELFCFCTACLCRPTLGSNLFGAGAHPVWLCII